MCFECAPVIDAWGYTYRASVIWDKAKHNQGHYVSVQHEFLLICTRGSATPDSTRRRRSIIEMKPRRSEDLAERLVVAERGLGLAYGTIGQLEAENGRLQSNLQAGADGFAELELERNQLVRRLNAALGR